MEVTAAAEQRQQRRDLDNTPTQNSNGAPPLSASISAMKSYTNVSRRVRYASNSASLIVCQRYEETGEMLSQIGMSCANGKTRYVSFSALWILLGKTLQHCVSGCSAEL